MSPLQEVSDDDVSCDCGNCKRAVAPEEIICLECAETMCDNAYLAGKQDGEAEADERY